MAEITASLIKELRDRTNAGMLDCKKALVESNGDLEEAADWLRKKGLAAASKKAGRVAAEGLVGVSIQKNKGAVVEVNAETDFVARNPTFQSYVKQVTELALLCEGDLAKLQLTPYPESGKTAAEELTQLVATIGENMQLRRSAFLTVSEGAVVSYIHNAISEGLGRIGVLIALESKAPKEKLEELGKQLAMHIAAAAPQSCEVADLDPETVARERDIYTAQAKESGKPAEFIEKMVEGRLRKFYEQAVFLEQVFVIDGERKILKVIEDMAAQAGHPIKVKGFFRFALGEGIEKQNEDFAAEVAAQLNK